MKVFDFTNDMKVARQGDVILYRLPEDMKIGRGREISPDQFGKLVLLEGEMTGHHHHIDLLDRPAAPAKPTAKTSKAVEDMLNKASNVAPPVVKFYSDTDTVNDLVKRKVLTRTDLAIGFLSVSGGGDVGVVLKHQEHDGIRLTAGNYYVGRQIESAGAEERLVRD